MADYCLSAREVVAGRSRSKRGPPQGQAHLRAAESLQQMLQQSPVEDEIPAEAFARKVMQWNRHRAASVQPRGAPHPPQPRYPSAPHLKPKHRSSPGKIRNSSGDSPRASPPRQPPADNTSRRLAEVSEELQAAHRQVAKLQKERKSTTSDVAKLEKALQTEPQPEP